MCHFQGFDQKLISKTFTIGTINVIALLPDVRTVSQHVIEDIWKKDMIFKTERDILN